MSETIAEIRRRHAEAETFESDGLDNAEWRASLTMLATRAHADRAELLARVAELEAAVNALPGLMAERDRMKEALEEIAAHYNGGITGPGRMQADSMREIARAALGEKP